jgi:hypothetical protein
MVDTPKPFLSRILTVIVGVSHTLWAVTFGWNIGALMYRFRPNTLGFKKNWIGPSFLTNLLFNGLNRGTSKNENRGNFDDNSSISLPTNSLPITNLKNSLVKEEEAPNSELFALKYTSKQDPSNNNYRSMMPGINSLTAMKNEWTGDTVSAQNIIKFLDSFENNNFCLNAKGDNACFVHSLNMCALLDKNTRETLQKFLENITINSDETSLEVDLGVSKTLNIALHNKDRYRIQPGYNLLKALIQTAAGKTEDTAARKTEDTAARNEKEALYAFALLNQKQIDNIRAFYRVLFFGLKDKFGSEILESHFKGKEAAIGTSANYADLSLAYQHMENKSFTYSDFLETDGLCQNEVHAFINLFEIKTNFLYNPRGSDFSDALRAKEGIDQKNDNKTGAYIISLDGSHYQVVSNSKSIAPLQEMLERSAKGKASNEDKIILNTFEQTLKNIEKKPASPKPSWS